MSRWRVLPAFALALAGCGRIDFDEVPRDARGGDARGDARGDGGGDARIDAGPIADCNAGVVGSTVALYPFEFPDGGADSTGAHDGMVRGTTTFAAATCGGGALGLGADGYVLVPDTPDFDLDEGSISFFFLTGTPAGTSYQGLFSRDANGTDFPGHLTIALAPNGQLLARLQRPAGDFYRCTTPVTANAWHHVGISFGGTFRMWLDHLPADGTDIVAFGGDTVTCDPALADTPEGIAGNDNVTIIGAFEITAANNDPDPSPTAFFTNASLDELRIENVAQDFSER